MKPIVQSRKLHKVRYDVRGPILVEAQRLEAEGHKILKLNIGNTAPFGFEAPEAILADMVHNLPDAQGYSDSRGIYSARTAVAQYYQSRGLRDTVVDDVFIGNGVSELISMVLTAFIDEGNEILVPAPDYPLWTGAVTLAGGTPVHYKCDESQDHAQHARAGRHQPQQPDRRGLQRGDRQGPGRHRASPPARPHGRRDLRKDPLPGRRRHRARPSPRRDVCR
jgi:aspartate/methionine/tyrosine aminotransferase